MKTRFIVLLLLLSLCFQQAVRAKPFEPSSSGFVQTVRGAASTAYRYPHLIIDLIDAKKSFSASRNPRSVIILGPGYSNTFVRNPNGSIVEKRTSAQLHELLPIFSKDQVEIVDKHQEVLDVIPVSLYDELSIGAAEAVINQDENFSQLDAKRRKTIRATLLDHLSDIPERLSLRNIKLTNADFSNYKLAPSSIDIMIATVSLGYAFENADSREAERLRFNYLNALKIGGKAYFTVAEAAGMLGTRPSDTTDDFELHEVTSRLPKTVSLSNGARFDFRIVMPFGDQKSRSQQSWGIVWQGYGRKFAGSTSPIYVFTRLEDSRQPSQKQDNSEL